MRSRLSLRLSGGSRRYRRRRPAGTEPRYRPHVNPWQRLAGTRAEPRRVANPGIASFYLVFAIAWLYLGFSAMTDGRTVQGVIGLGLALASSALAVSTRRKRQDGRE